MSSAPEASRPTQKTRRAAPAWRFDKGGLFRLCRLLHAYISAFAFLTLIFFTATGLMLNHPAWFEAFAAKESTVVASLSAGELAQAKAAADPPRALAAAIASKTPLRGAYSSGDIAGGQALLRLDGPKGTSDITLDMTSGKAQIRLSSAPVLLMTQELHRGKNSGAVWGWVIDLSAYLILAMSLIGYVLFFSLRFRLRTSLILTGISLAVLVGIIVACVP